MFELWFSFDLVLTDDLSCAVYDRNACTVFLKDELGIDISWQDLVLVGEVWVFDLLVGVEPFVDIIGHGPAWVGFHVIVARE